MASSSSAMKDLLSTAYTSEPNLRLRQAAFRGDLCEVKKLLKEGGLEINAAQRGKNPETGGPYSARTALHHAVINNHLRVALLLYRAGWSIYAVDSQGKSIQELASKEFIQILRSLAAQMWLRGRVRAIFGWNKLEQKLPPKPEQPLRILSLACGFAIEIPVLAELFAQRNLSFKGVDIDEAICADSRELAEDEGIANVDIIQGDATDVSWLQSALGEERFDLIILRHPDVTSKERREIFATILEKTIPAFIKAEGLVFISTYSSTELARATTYLKADFDSIDPTIVAPKGQLTFFNQGVTQEPDKFSLLYKPNLQLQQRIAPPEKENPCVFKPS